MAFSASVVAKNWVSSDGEDLRDGVLEEEGRRRGEIALYVLPRALRTLLNESWLKSGTRNVMALERCVQTGRPTSLCLTVPSRLAFAVSLASIITATRHYPETLRGLSRWTAMFILKGEPRG